MGSQHSKSCAVLAVIVSYAAAEDYSVSQIGVINYVSNSTGLSILAFLVVAIPFLILGWFLRACWGNRKLAKDKKKVERKSDIEAHKQSMARQQEYLAQQAITLKQVL